jgi:hypothetical protein
MVGRGTFEGQGRERDESRPTIGVSAEIEETICHSENLTLTSCK